MDLEELTKSQIVLLTLLVSFVTSIATGIVTVAIIEQAPTDVTRVIQRTVERTVEKVVPETRTKIVTQEKRVIVRESDLIASAVKNNRPSVVRVYRKGLDGDIFLGLGAVVSGQGTVVTDAAFISPDTVYQIVTEGKAYDAKVLNPGGGRGVAILSIINSNIIPRPAGIFDGSVPLGKTVILMSGEDTLEISTGVVTSLAIGEFAANVDSAMVLPGSVLLTSDGNIIGISTATSRLNGANSFVSARSILASITAPVIEIEEDTNTDDETASSTEDITGTSEELKDAENETIDEADTANTQTQQASAAAALGTEEVATSTEE